MRAIFRADASIEIGSGHVFRCLTLAHELRLHGADCTFICRELAGNLIHVITERGFKVYPLPSPQHPVSAADIAGGPAHASWLGCSWYDDASQVLDVLRSYPADLLVVDHYALDQRWEQALRAAGRRVLAIDDLADRRHACDMLLDSSLDRVRSDYADLVPTSCTLLLGSAYALLRPEFLALREQSLARRAARPDLSRILISMGGVDQSNATDKALAALAACPLPRDVRISVLMGHQAQWAGAVKARAETLPWKTEVMAGISDVAQLMADSDLSIGAAGMTAWERCCLGLPSLLVTLADNQIRGARALHAAGASINIGTETELGTNLPRGLDRLMTSEARLEMSARASRIVDGRGTERVAGAVK